MIIHSRVWMTINATIMQFTSFNFVLFFVVFYLFYFIFRKRIWLQNLWLLMVSYAFYNFFGWRFLLILVFMTFTDFSLGWLMGRLDHQEPHKAGLRKLLLAVSVIIDLGLLVVFKYFGFFSEEIARILNMFGLQTDPTAFNLLLPVGISFYALKSLSYTLDVYHGRQIPTGNLLEYAVFVAFFPALLAGPIDRARKLLPQVSEPRRITPSKFSAGLFLILWGYFKKLVIADNLAVISSQIFENWNEVFGIDILLGILAFTMQIYADFSGYSDIARGLARMMGFELMINFKLPYFALNPSEWWQRWHISLSEWLRDYIFFPLRRTVLSWRGKYTFALAMLIPPLATMLVSGFWHGTGWNFVFWGFYHGVLMVLYRLATEVNIPAWLERIANTTVGRLFRVSVMFGLVSLGWVFFRASTLEQAFSMLAHVSFALSTQSLSFINDLLFFTLPLLVVQLLQAWMGDLLAPIRQRFPVQVLVHSVLLVWIVIFGARQVTEFIYSQF